MVTTHLHRMASHFRRLPSLRAKKMPTVPPQPVNIYHYSGLFIAAVACLLHDHTYPFVRPCAAIGANVPAGADLL
jgi:hypothetical protein